MTQSDALTPLLTMRQQIRLRLLRFVFRTLALVPLGVIRVTLLPIVRFTLSHLLHYRQEMIEHNLRLAYPQISDRELREERLRIYHHLSRLLLYQAKYAYGHDGEIKRLFRLEHVDLLKDLRVRGHRQLLLLLGHVGPWELFGSSVLHLDRSQYDVYVIYKRLTDPVMDQLMREMRARHYAHGMEMSDLVRHLMRHHGETEPEAPTEVYCLLADQAPHRTQIQYATRFFDQPTLFITGWSQLAVRQQLPVLFFWIDYDTEVRQWVGRFELIEESPGVEDAWRLVDLYADHLEQNIRISPHRWLWSHNRWRLNPYELDHITYSPKLMDELDSSHHEMR